MKWGWIPTLLLLAGCALSPGETTTRPHFLGVWVETAGTACPKILVITLANADHITVDGNELTILPGRTIVSGPEMIGTRDAQFALSSPDLLSYAQVGPKMGAVCGYTRGDAYTSTRPDFVNDWQNSQSIGSRCANFPSHAAISYADADRVTVNGKTWPVEAASAGMIFTRHFGLARTEAGLNYFQPGQHGWDICPFMPPPRALPVVTGAGGEKLYRIRPPLPPGLTGAVPKPGPFVDTTGFDPGAPVYCAVMDVDANGKASAVTMFLSTGNAMMDDRLTRFYRGRDYQPALLDGKPIGSRELVRFTRAFGGGDHCEWDYYDQHPPQAKPAH